MIALLQRVRQADVRIAGECVGHIGGGLLALIGIRQQDSAANAVRLAERIVRYRIFADAAGRMDRSLLDMGGGLLLVPQFTLAAATDKGNRPSFAPAAPPALAEPLFATLVEQARGWQVPVQTGRFGAEMEVALINHGPVTFWLEG